MNRGSFWLFINFSLESRALDHTATAPPKGYLIGQLYQGAKQNLKDNALSAKWNNKQIKVSKVDNLDFSGLADCESYFVFSSTCWGLATWRGQRLCQKSGNW